ncbi:MAG TPA: hypothetical protein VMV69_00025 [Pirellulales bacterium]|nr:hypothetical protein [Pirellulales bacterium]
MLTDAELAALLADTESDRVERKASIGDRDRIRQAICAFANDLPDYRLPGDLPFDQRLVRGATLEDLDLDLFQRAYLPSALAADVLAENDRAIPLQLP